METSTAERVSSTHTDPATAGRIKIMAAALVVTSLAAIAVGLLWLEPAGGGETYSYADIAGDRDQWWAVLNLGAVNGIVNVALLALATLVLVRGRGSAWATWGAVAMWLGIALQAAGVAGWASAYYYATDPEVSAATGRAVIEAANNDQAHLFALMIPGAGLALIGTILQCVGLFRAHVVPTWVPVGLLFTVLTFVIPGSGLAGLITSIPMTAGAIGLAYFVVRRTAGTPAS